MAEATVTETEEAAATKKKGKGKLLFLGLNVLLFLAGAGFFALTHFGILGAPPVSETAVDGEAKGEEQSEPAIKSQPCAPDKEMMAALEEESVLIELAPFIVNLRGDRGRRYLSLTMQLEVPDEDQKVVVEKYLAKIRNRLIFLLSNKTFAEVTTPEGKYDLQDEIRRHANEVLRQELVTKILFTNFVVQ